MNLLRSDLELADGVEVIISFVDIPPGTELPKHHHPGEEFIYALEGSGTIWLKDQPGFAFKAGDVFKIPLGQVHTAITGEEGAKAVVFRVHKKAEPDRVLEK